MNILIDRTVLKKERGAGVAEWPPDAAIAAMEEFDHKHQRFLERHNFAALKNNFEARRQCFLINHARWSHYDARHFLELMGAAGP